MIKARKLALRAKPRAEESGRHSVEASLPRIQHQEGKSCSEDKQGQDWPSRVAVVATEWGRAGASLSQPSHNSMPPGHSLRWAADKEGGQWTSTEWALINTSLVCFLGWPYILTYSQKIHITNGTRKEWTLLQLNFIHFHTLIMCWE